MSPRVTKLSSWDDLRFVLAVAQTGSLSLAAKRLGTNQSTVSRRLLQLEDTLQGKLFERTRRGTKPTALGKTLLEGATRVERDIFEIDDSLQHSQRIEGQVRLTMTEELAAHFVIPKIYPLIEKRYPDLRLHLVTGDALLDLENHDADLALRFAQTKHGDLVGRKLAEVRLALLAKQSVAKRIRALPLEPINFLTCLPANGSGSFAKLGIPTTRHTFSTMSSVVAAVRAGLGVGVAAAPLLQVYPELVEITLPNLRLPSMPLYLVTRTSIRHSPRIDALFRLFTEELRKLASG